MGSVLIVLELITQNHPLDGRLIQGKLQTVGRQKVITHFAPEPP